MEHHTGDSVPRGINLRGLLDLRPVFFRADAASHGTTDFPDPRGLRHGNDQLD